MITRVSFFTFVFASVCLSSHALAESVLRFVCEKEDVGASIYVNGVLRGNCPSDIFVSAGDIHLRVVSAVDGEYERVFEDSFSIFDKSAKKVRVTFPDHRFPEDAVQRSKEANEKADTIEQENFINLLGFQVKELDSKALNELGIEGGVEVYRVDDGAAREAGILQGDIIARLNNMSFDDIYKFKDVVKDLPQNRAVPVLIIRQKKPFFIVLKLDK